MVRKTPFSMLLILAAGIATFVAIGALVILDDGGNSSYEGKWYDFTDPDDVYEFTYGGPVEYDVSCHLEGDTVVAVVDIDSPGSGTIEIWFEDKLKHTSKYGRGEKSYTINFQGTGFTEDRVLKGLDVRFPDRESERV